MTLTGVGGVVLCGGKSQRMGYSKADLPFGNELLLQRVVRRLAETVSPIVVVHAEAQSIAALPKSVLTATDERPGLGPLQGIRCGLGALQGNCERAFVTSCDAPLIRREFIRHLFDRMGASAIAIPEDASRLYPLAAIYDVELSGLASDLLNQGVRRPIVLLDHVRAVRVSMESIQSVDPELDSLINLNDPRSYVEALQRCHLDLDAEIARRLGIDIGDPSEKES